MLKLFSGMVSPDSGDIFYNGDNISDMNTVTLRREVLLCSQSVYLFDGDIKSCFDEFYSYRGLEIPDEQTIKRYMDICQINLPLDTKTSSMSGGERQRVFIAICLSFMPKVLMLDEPTSALDSQTANLLMNSLCKFCRDNSMTFIVISHDTELCKEFCDREINLKKRI